MADQEFEPRRDYSSYDRRYVQLRQDGKSGWVDRDSPNYAIHLEALGRVLAAGYCPTSGPALDAGCGAGCWSLVLADYGFDVTGIDLSPTSIAWAKERVMLRPPDRPGSATFRVSTAMDLSWLPEDSFSFVLDGFLLHCLVGSDRHAYLREIHRILYRAGIFFVQSFCADDPAAPEWDSWNIAPETRYRFDEDGLADKYVGSTESILNDLRRAGFSPVEYWMTPIAGGMLQVACSW